MKFVDLFCGIGGFHVALKPFAECVFACDLDSDCRDMYRENFNMIPLGDIRTIKEQIPPHDLLTAGFPCQPFSKSGSQLGFLDKIRGTLFEDIMDVIRMHKPKYVLLENVRNLHSHDGGNTFAIIRGALIEEGYHVAEKILSPDDFGVPHFRERIFIVGINKEKVRNWKDFDFPSTRKKDTHVDDIREVDLTKEELDSCRISKHELDTFEHWSEFMHCLPDGVTPPSPTWAMEFGRSYPLTKIHPISRQSRKQLCRILSEEGIEISPDKSRREILGKFPPYIRSMKKVLPEWKINFIKKNREFWQKYGEDMPNGWLERTHDIRIETFQKLEWHVGPSSSKEIMSHMIHTRPSGIRVSKLNRIPALVAIAQIPIIGPWGRRITPREGANAQSFPDDFRLHPKRSVAFRQLGNSVNVIVVREIITKLLELELTIDTDNPPPEIQYSSYPEYTQ